MGLVRRWKQPRHNDSPSASYSGLFSKYTCLWSIGKGSAVSGKWSTQPGIVNQARGCSHREYTIVASFQNNVKHLQIWNKLWAISLGAELFIEKLCVVWERESRIRAQAYETGQVPFW